MNKYIKIPLCIFGCIVLALFSIFLLLNIFNIPVFNYYFGLVQTQSMEPALNKNDLIIYSQQQEYKTGDIVCFIQNSRLTAHRIVAVNGENIVTKGDNSTQNDVAVTSNQILGEVVYKSAFLGNILAFFQHFSGIFIILALFLLILYIFKFKKRNYPKVKH